jgi:hypothetical protein
MLSEVKKNATQKLARININPDIADRNSEIVTRKIVQRRWSPALAPVKSASLRMALVKFAPRMSAPMNFAPVRS